MAGLLTSMVAPLSASHQRPPIRLAAGKDRDPEGKTRDSSENEDLKGKICVYISSRKLSNTQRGRVSSGMLAFDEILQSMHRSVRSMTQPEERREYEGTSRRAEPIA